MCNRSSFEAKLRENRREEMLICLLLIIIDGNAEGIQSFINYLRPPVVRHRRPACQTSRATNQTFS